MGHFGRGIRHKAQHDGFEVDQQRIRRGVVRPQRLAVKAGRVARGQRKGTAVEHDVALDARHTLRLQTAQQQPKPLNHQARIALTAQVNVALQHTVFDRAVHIHRGVPSESRPQQIQRGSGGDQLHQRSRVDADLGSVLPDRRFGPQWVEDDHAHGVGGDFEALQGLGQFGRPRGVPLAWRWSPCFSEGRWGHPCGGLRPSTGVHTPSRHTKCRKKYFPNRARMIEHAQIICAGGSGGREEV